jgi:autotransporter passenger strand-loop-strand repeat protein
MTIINAGNSPYYVSSGVIDTGDIISSGGTEIVLSSGITSNATIYSGGDVVVSSGGTDLGGTISSGGYEIVSSGGVLSSATIDGGTLELASGIADTGGTITFAANDAGKGTLLIDGTSMPANPIADFGGVGGFAETIDLTGVGNFVSGVSASFVPVSSGATSGSLRIVEDGQTYVLNLIDVTPGLVVSAGPDSGSGTLITVGGSIVSVTSSNETFGFNFVVSSGTSYEVMSGGTAGNTVVSSGGGMYVYSTAEGSGTTISSGGGEVVFSGGAD